MTTQPTITEVLAQALKDLLTFCGPFPPDPAKAYYVDAVAAGDAALAQYAESKQVAAQDVVTDEIVSLALSVCEYPPSAKDMRSALATVAPMLAAGGKGEAKA